MRKEKRLNQSKQSISKAKIVMASTAMQKE
jgi:hypothetical protein